MHEIVNGKSEKSSSDKIKLSIISLIHHELGSRKETYLPISRVRLLFLLYLSDLEWYRQKGETYLGGWIYANGGPLLQDFGTCCYR